MMGTEFRYIGGKISGWFMLEKPGNVLWMCPANERWRYNVTSSLIGWAHSQNHPWETSIYIHQFDLSLSESIVCHNSRLLYIVYKNNRAKTCMFYNQHVWVEGISFKSFRQLHVLVFSCPLTYHSVFRTIAFRLHCLVMSLDSWDEWCTYQTYRRPVSGQCL